MSIQEDEHISASVAVSPTTRVSLADIEASILYECTQRGTALMGVMYDTPEETTARERLRIITLHVIVMKNGFTVIGKSAPADAENFNAEVGKKFAREDAIRQLWPLMGYALRDQLMKDNAQ